MRLMRVEVLPNAGVVGMRAAARVCATASARPDAWLGLPTGSTPIPMYAELRRLSRTSVCDLSRATACALDEFCASAQEPGTNAAFYRQHVGFLTATFRAPDPTAADPAGEVGLLAAAIQQHRGLDLCVLGIGTNGHIAFNEPGSARDSRGRVVDLTQASREAHAESFGGLA